jgi:DNA (cytosine-5)-methyltransferase 1
MNAAAPLTRDARRVLNQLGDAVADAGWTATARRSGVDRVTLHRLLRYLSVCAGIEAATVAWHPLGWTPAAFSEIEPFPRAVLRRHWPHVPIHGRDRLKGESFEDHAEDAGFQTIGADDYGPIDLLVGGTPCQSFSIAGKRGGMADGRGNLALEYIRLADRKRARWVVWENVPGVFSSNGGEDFRCFLSGLVRWDVPIPDGGWRNAGVVAAGPADGAFGVAWRVLDAQFAGVPQRRRRVFVVGHLGDWRRAAAVLFERHSLSGHPAPRRQAGKELPQLLARALRAVADSEPTSTLTAA